MNPVKVLIYKTYCFYDAHFPLAIGKYRLGRLLRRIFGLAIFTIQDFLMELEPVAVLDRTLIMGNEHDDDVAQAIRQAPSRSIFIDIGANIGYFSLLASVHGMDVEAFEPSPRELKRLRSNILLNNSSSVAVHPYGLSKTEETLPLRLGKDYNPGTNSVLETRASDESVLCKFKPLSRALSPEILARTTVCKIDVEGFEMSVLGGMENSMQFLKGTTFVIEIARKYLDIAGNTPQDIYTFFEKHGFKPKRGLQNESRYDEVFTRSTK